MYGTEHLKRYPKSYLPNYQLNQPSNTVPQRITAVVQRRGKGRSYRPILPLKLATIFSFRAIENFLRSAQVVYVEEIKIRQSHSPTSQQKRHSPRFFQHWGAFDSVKNHKRQRRKLQSVTAKREKSQTPKFV